jgi:hypothetical protein
MTKRLIATPRTFYGHSGHSIAVCIWCSEPCDADPRYRDHLGGWCVELQPEAFATSARALVLLYARTHEHVSANEIRSAWPARWAATSEHSRGGAFGTLVRHGYLERVGLERSTSGATHGAETNRYVSRVYVPRRRLVAA